MAQLIHPAFRPVRPMTPEQAFNLMAQDIQNLGKIVNGLTDGLAQLYERFYMVEKHLGITVVEEPPAPTTATSSENGTVAEACPNCGQYACAGCEPKVDDIEIANR